MASMADFEKIIRGFQGEDGTIPADAIAKLEKASEGRNPEICL